MPEINKKLLVFERIYSELGKNQVEIAPKNKLPKLIHFVWAGGKRQMPQEDISRVMQWAKKYPNFKIYIWVDYQSANGVSNEEKKKVVVDHFKQIIRTTVTNIELKDVRESLFFEFNYGNQKVYDFFNYEIERLRPNYGASSDILRYSILYNFGGAYFDTEIVPGTKQLDEIINFDQLKNCCLWVEGNSQGHQIVGNDAFIATKGNPILRQLLDNALQNYSQLTIVAANTEDKKIISNFPQACDAAEFIKTLTPWLTGPRVVGNILSGESEDKFFSQEKAFSERTIKEDLIGEILQLPTECRRTLPNNCSWVNMKLQRLNDDPEIMLFKLAESNVFELINMNLWKLNDTFYNYYELTGEILDLDKYFKIIREILLSKGFSLEQFLDDHKITIQPLLTLQESKEIYNYCTGSVKEILKKYALPMFIVYLMTPEHVTQYTVMEEKNLTPTIVRHPNDTIKLIVYDEKDIREVEVTKKEDVEKLLKYFTDTTNNNSFGSPKMTTLDRNNEIMQLISTHGHILENRKVKDTDIEKVDIDNIQALSDLNKKAKSIKQESSNEYNVLLKKIGVVNSDSEPNKATKLN